MALRLMAANPNTDQAHCLLPARSAPASIAGAIPHYHPTGRAIDRPRLHIGRVFAICVMGGLEQLRRHGRCGDGAWRGGEPDGDILWSVLVSRGGLWIPAVNPAVRPSGLFGRS